VFLVVLLHDPYDELPHGRVANVLELLREPLQLLVVLLLQGQELLGLGEEPIAFAIDWIERRDRCRFAGQLGGRADGGREVVEHLMMASLVVQDEARQVGERR